MSSKQNRMLVWARAYRADTDWSWMQIWANVEGIVDTLDLRVSPDEQRFAARVLRRLARLSKV